MDSLGYQPVPRDPISGQTIHDYLPRRAIRGTWPDQTLVETEARCLICGEPPDHTRHLEVAR